jgi:hypothetical protein
MLQQPEGTGGLAALGSQWWLEVMAHERRRGLHDVAEREREGER